MISKKRRDKAANLEKDEILNPEEVKKRKESFRMKIVMYGLGTLCILIVALLTTVSIVRAVGKNSLKKGVEATHPELVQIEEEAIPEEEKENWEEGWVKYDGKTYKPKDKILTFLIMGIDNNNNGQDAGEGMTGGSADAEFLLVLNQADQSINVIAINRNTMADVDIYNEDGAYVDTQKAQICIQHGFGAGGVESDERQVNAVSKLFYNLPIHGYAAIKMDALPILNDAVGGVDLVAMEDIKNKKHRVVIKKGEEVHLEGENALLYVMDRNTDEFGSSDNRLSRQKQYMTEYINQAKRVGKKNIGIVSDIYKAIEQYMTTDVSLDEVMYLAPEVVNYSFVSDGFHSVKGETVQGNKFEEFYPDETDLYELVLEVFYEEVLQ